MNSKRCIVLIFTDFHRFEKRLEIRGELITKLEYQRKPKWKENSIEFRTEQPILENSRYLL